MKAAVPRTRFRRSWVECGRRRVGNDERIELSDILKVDYFLSLSSFGDESRLKGEDVENVPRGSWG